MYKPGDIVVTLYTDFRGKLRVYELMRPVPTTPDAWFFKEAGWATSNSFIHLPSELNKNEWDNIDSFTHLPKELYKFVYNGTLQPSFIIKYFKDLIERRTTLCLEKCSSIQNNFLRYDKTYKLGDKVITIYTDNRGFLNIYELGECVGKYNKIYRYKTTQDSYIYNLVYNLVHTDSIIPLPDELNGFVEDNKIPVLPVLRYLINLAKESSLCSEGCFIIKNEEDNNE